MDYSNSQSRGYYHPQTIHYRRLNLYHPSARQGNRHLEYINDRGTYADLPIAEIIQTFELQYKFSSQKSASLDGNFDRDMAIEVAIENVVEDRLK